MWPKTGVLVLWCAVKPASDSENILTFSRRVYLRIKRGSKKSVFLSVLWASAAPVVLMLLAGEHYAL